MWNRKELKRNARKTLRANYVSAVIVCLVLAYIVGAYPILSSVQNETAVEIAPRVYYRTSSNSEIVDSIIGGFQMRNGGLYEILEQPTANKGVLAGLFNSVTRSGSFVFGILNAINQFAFGDGIAAGFVILAGAAILFLFWLLVGNILRIGACRFFMESHIYPKTRANRLLYLYRIRRVRHPAFLMLLKTVYITLWSLTIVGGIVKNYAWRMVPYIIAENPEISAKDAFWLSSRMMKGNKWKAFLLDLSFAGWYLLSAVTLGLSSYLITNPYRASCEAELYLKLRSEVTECDHLFWDPYLASGPDMDVAPGEYPVHLYPIPDAPAASWLSTDYNVRYTLPNLVLIFFSFCLVGYLWEVFVDLFNTGHLVNRGTLHGPWLPIYGTGGVLVVLLFRRLGARPVVTFFSVMVFCGVLEFFTSWVLERYTGQRWWDYSGYYLNIGGRVCLEGLLVFALGGCVGIYFLAPALNNLFEKIPAKVKRPICLVLVTVFCCDLAFSAFFPNTEAATIAADADMTQSASTSATGSAAHSPLCVGQKGP